MYLLVSQRLLIEALLDLIYFPLWWYSKGALHVRRWCWNLLKDGNDRLAPGLWLANIFVPMYGQYDWQGRIISFFMRCAQIIGRGFALAVWLGFCVVLFGVWLLLPMLVVYGVVGSAK